MREYKFRAWGATEYSDWKPEMQFTFDIESADGEIFYGGEAQPDWILMQFTGLKDKNGKDIYEGDIVKQGETITSVVYNAPSFRFEKPASIAEKAKPIEVIGNIYENST